MVLHKDLIMSHRFLVYIGMDKISFAKVSGIDAVMTKETFAEGGENHWPYVMTVPKEQLQTLRLERGLQISGNVSHRIRTGMWIPWLEIIVKNDKGKPVYEYYVIGAYVTKWEIGDLDAATGNVIIETFEVEHSGMEKVSLR